MTSRLYLDFRPMLHEVVHICQNKFNVIVIRLSLSPFQEKKSVRPTFSAERIFGGSLLAMCSNDFVCFYDWVECRLIRRIDVNVKVGLLSGH